MVNPPPSFAFTSNEMGSIPVRSWSSTLVILFGQKMCMILLRHFFWNTSSMWHIPLVTFQDCSIYQYAQFVALENAYLCFLADRFRLPGVLQSRKCSPCLVDPCLDFSLCVSIFCHLGSQVCELCYVFWNVRLMVAIYRYSFSLRIVYIFRKCPESSGAVSPVVGRTLCTPASRVRFPV